MDQVDERQAFFGDPWPSGVCDDGVQVETPVGIPCALCHVPVAEGDRGSFVNQGGEQWPAHRECLLRMVLGPIEHLERRCPCHGGVYEGGALSLRDNALAVWDWVQAHGMPTSA